MMHYNGSNSGVQSYEISDDKSEINVVFKGGKSYTYPCDEHVEKLAEGGAGLNTWINTTQK